MLNEIFSKYRKQSDNEDNIDEYIKNEQIDNHSQTDNEEKNNKISNNNFKPNKSEDFLNEKEILNTKKNPMTYYPNIVLYTIKTMQLSH